MSTGRSRSKRSAESSSRRARVAASVTSQRWAALAADAMASSSCAGVARRTVPTRSRRSCGESVREAVSPPVVAAPFITGPTANGVFRTFVMSLRRAARVPFSVSANPELALRAGQKISRGRAINNLRSPAVRSRSAISAGSAMISPTDVSSSAKRLMKDVLAPFSSRRRTK